ncbi:MAG: chorismate--pyruvate lyase family protein [Pseudomonadales bacterium]
MPQLFQSDEPRWQDHRRFFNIRLTPNTRVWLLDEGSLTARLVAASSEFSVQVLAQGWQRPRPSERRCLQLKTRDLALVREVALVCDGQPRVFARSILPHDTLTGSLHHLRHFGSQSLGSLLYQDPFLHRASFELAYSGAAEFGIPADISAAEGLSWGRRSRFLLRQKPLLVSEIFLPAFNEPFKQKR